MYVHIADLVTIIHILLIVIVLAGIPISIIYKKYRPIQSIILLSTVIIWILFDGCPLTYIENTLRINNGHPLPIVESGFIVFYLNKWFDLSISNFQLTVVTYIAAFVFVFLSLGWLKTSIKKIQVPQFLNINVRGK